MESSKAGSDSITNPRLVFKQRNLDYDCGEKKLIVEFSTFVNVNREMISRGESLEFRFLFKGAVSVASVNDRKEPEYKRQFLLSHKYTHKFCLRRLEHNRPGEKMPEEEEKLEVLSSPEGLGKTHEELKFDFYLNINNSKLKPSLFLKGVNKNGPYGVKVSYSIKWDITNPVVDKQIKERFYVRNKAGLHAPFKEIQCDEPFNRTIKIVLKDDNKLFPADTEARDSNNNFGVCDGTELELAEKDLRSPMKLYWGRSEVRIRLEGILSFLGKQMIVYTSKPIIIKNSHGGNIQEALLENLFVEKKPGRRILQTAEYLEAEATNQRFKLKFYLRVNLFRKIRFLPLGGKEKPIQRERIPISVPVTLPERRLSQEEKRDFEKQKHDQGYIALLDFNSKCPQNVAIIEESETRNYWGNKGEERFRSPARRLWE